MKRAYAVYDVFTDKPLSGNPLAVVFESEGLDTGAMQAIAGEFNLSETVFIGDPEDAAHTAALRIFTPRFELPFAGHPTVGAAIAIAEQRYGGSGTPDAALFVLEEKVGPVRTAVGRLNGNLFAEFDLPKLPEPLVFEAEKEQVAAALGLEPIELGFENHAVSMWNAGVPYVTIPVHGLEAIGRAALNTERWLGLFAKDPHAAPSPYVYCRDTVNHDCAFHARMFAPHHGIAEDPATGSAVAAFAGAIAYFDEPVDGPSQWLIEQGLEMGRPSRIRLEMDIGAGVIEAARIGGSAVCVAAGHLLA